VHFIFLFYATFLCQAVGYFKRLLLAVQCIQGIYNPF
jgi:uncharacterized membrane protein